MCDYSLLHVASRSAAVGDKLVSTRFESSISRGFSADGEPNVAVCLLPGTEIAFDREVEFDRFPLDSTGKTTAKVARFRQVNLTEPHTHHDALEFPDGEIVLLTRLVPGQQATVLQLPAAPRTPEEAAEQQRLAVVA